MEDNSSFFNYMKMEPLKFDEILNRVSPRIHKTGCSDNHSTISSSCSGVRALNIFSSSHRQAHHCLPALDLLAVVLAELGLLLEGLAGASPARLGQQDPGGGGGGGLVIQQHQV